MALVPGRSAWRGNRHGSIGGDTLRALLLAAALLALIAIPFLSRADVGVACVYEPSSRSLVRVAGAQLGTLTRVAGQSRLRMPVLAFAGIDSSNRMTTGLTATFQYQLANELTVNVGPALLLRAGKVRGASVYLGVSYRF